MISATTYRGPDSQGHQVFRINDRQYFLGSNRLKITDTSKNAHQPFTSTSTEKPAALIFNGEIYNYSDLRDEMLHAGEKFISKSDTEVLFKLLLNHKEKAFDFLNGMYAFIFLDTRTEEVWLARDPWGIKPLYYYKDDDVFIASSEIKGILASGLVPKELNEEAVKDYLQYRYVRRPATFFKHIYEFETGSFLKISNGEFEELKFQKSNDGGGATEEIELNTKGVIRKTEDLLLNALAHHVPAYASSALFLSGGVDSTLILALLKELGHNHFPTYSIASSPEDRKMGTRDYEYSRLAAKTYDSDHHEIQTDSSVLEELDEFVINMDQPVGDSGALLTFLLSKEVAKNHKIVFTGSGADELFGGYNRHAAFWMYLKNYRFLNLIKRLGIVGSSLLSPISNNRSRLARKFFTNLHSDPAVTYNRFISFQSISPQANNPLWSIQSNDQNHFSKAIEHDRSNYLVSDVLAIGDRMSMLAQIEMRVPYLDDHLCRYIRSIPPSYLIKHGKKWILKEILRKRNGEIFARRSKEGFGLPFAGWIDINKTNTWSFLDDKESKLFNFIEKKRILEMKTDHGKGKRNFALELWALIILAKWLDFHFK